MKKIKAVFAAMLLASAGLAGAATFDISGVIEGAFGGPSTQGEPWCDQDTAIRDPKCKVIEE